MLATGHGYLLLITVVLSTNFQLIYTQPIAAVTVDITPSHMTNSFDPDMALGATVDILSASDIDWIYSKPILNISLSAGWTMISYRQNTEQTMGAWHWNPAGSWSDPVNQSGYFTGSVELGEPIKYSYGYPLPHRGNTQNLGTTGGYSRMTDGDLTTYWKSNPYLTSQYTGQDDTMHPQWVVIQFDQIRKVNALKIEGSNPYAVDYIIEYWTGDDAMNNPLGGVWALFSDGLIVNGTGGTVLHNLTAIPVAIQYIRIWMTKSSNTCDTHGSTDHRNCVGYAITELYSGYFDNKNGFVDVLVHHPSGNQSFTYCSSIDSWHSAKDISTREVQTGMDLFFTSGITSNIPPIMAVTPLYGTPDDSAAQIAYIKKRGYQFSYVELGEEPDGQYIIPEDYAELYIQFVKAIHQVDPNIKMGGPVFTGVNEDVRFWPDSLGRTSWMGRFVDYLRARGHIQDLAFISFEHYPWNPCIFNWSLLYTEPDLVTHIMQVWRDDGVPDVPMLITESGISWALTEKMDEIFTALWLADFVGSFLNAGGDVVVRSPVNPETLRKGCDDYGTFGNFVVDKNLQIQQFTSGYHASRLINFEWTTHGTGIHKMYSASCNLLDPEGNILITVYALNCPNGEWSLLLVNRDQLNAHSINITFTDSSSGTSGYFDGPVRMVTFGSSQYVWQKNGINSRADPDNPPVVSMVSGGDGVAYKLPQASVNVLRGIIKKKVP